MKKIALLLATVILATGALSACGGGGGAAEGISNKVFTVCTGPNPATIDPALNQTTDGSVLLVHGFEGLMGLDKDVIPVPGQAESYTMSDDGLTYTFKLRPSSKWSDGTPLTSADFMYSWNRAIKPETASPYEYLYAAIKGYEEGKLAISAPDENTFVVELNAPTPYFLELCAFPVFFPVNQAVVEANPEAWAIEATTYVSNGPYKMIEWVQDDFILYEKNKNYWNYKALGPDKIKFKLMSDANAQFGAFKNGDLAFVDNIPTEELDGLAGNPEYYKVGNIGTYYVSFNTQKAPFDNPKVRQALSLAIDREWICKNVGKAGQIPAGAYVPVGVPDAEAGKEFRDIGKDFYDPSPAGYEANVAKAKTLLAEAGFPDGKGFPTVEYMYNSDGTGHAAIGEALQNMWSTQLGVNVTLKSQEWATFINSRQKGDYFIARNGWNGDFTDPISFLDMLITGGGNNDSQWSNPEYDTIIKKITSSFDKKERFDLMHQAEDMIMSDDNFLLAPIYYYVDVYMLSSKVEGVYSTPMANKYFMYAKVK